MSLPRALRRPAETWAFFFGLALLYSLSPSDWGAAQTSRYLVAHAIAFEGTLAPTGIERASMDWSMHDGRFYSNKPPGAALLMVPPLFLARIVERALGHDPAQEEKLHRQIADVFASSIPGALLAALVFAYLAGFSAITPRARLAGLYAYAFGTIAYPYSVSIWGHQTASLFLFAAFFLVTRKRSFFWAGLLFGCGELTEYTVVLAAPAFALLLWTEKARLRAFLHFCIGGLPAFALFAAYHSACFGAWYHLAPLFQNPALQDGASSLGVFNFPRKGPLYDLIFGLDRGLLIVSPVLLLAPWGIYRWWRSGERFAELAACLWIGFAFWLFNASYNGWHGGCAFGPRYLVPILPFLAVFLAWAKPGKLFAALSTWSAINMLGAVAVGVALCPKSNVLWKQVYPTMASGAILLNCLLPLAAGMLVLVALGPWLLAPKAIR